MGYTLYKRAKHIWKNICVLPVLPTECFSDIKCSSLIALYNHDTCVLGSQNSSVSRSSPMMMGIVIIMCTRNYCNCSDPLIIWTPWILQTNNFLIVQKNLEVYSLLIKILSTHSCCLLVCCRNISHYVTYLMEYFTFKLLRNCRSEF